MDLVRRYQPYPKVYEITDHNTDSELAGVSASKKKLKQFKFTILNVSFDCFLAADALPKLRIGTTFLTDCIQACVGMPKVPKIVNMSFFVMADWIIVIYCMQTDLCQDSVLVRSRQACPLTYVHELNPSCFYNHSHI